MLSNLLIPHPSNVDNLYLTSESHEESPMVICINMPGFRMSGNMHQLLSSVPHPNREAKQLKEERVPLAHSLRIQFIMVGTSGERDLEETWSYASVSSLQRIVAIAAQVPFSFPRLYNHMKWCHPRLGVSSKLYCHNPENPSQTLTEETSV